MVHIFDILLKTQGYNMFKKKKAFYFDRLSSMIIKTNINLSFDLNYVCTNIYFLAHYDVRRIKKITFINLSTNCERWH